MEVVRVCKSRLMQIQKDEDEVVRNYLEFLVLFVLRLVLGEIIQVEKVKYNYNVRFINNKEIYDN